jgi:hypothetical protein
MSAAGLILERLERVRQTGPGRWIACCPAHNDQSPSLSIRQLDDRVLLHDFGGCETSDVLAALGLELRDLFDQPRNHRVAPTNLKIPAREVLQLLSFEIDTAAMLLADVVAGRSISEPSWSRIAQAAARIGAAKVYVHGD